MTLTKALTDCLAVLHANVPAVKNKIQGKYSKRDARLFVWSSCNILCMSNIHLHYCVAIRIYLILIMSLSQFLISSIQLNNVSLSFRRIVEHIFPDDNEPAVR